MRLILLVLACPLTRAALETIELGPRGFFNYDRLIPPSKAASTLMCKSSIAADVVALRFRVERFHNVDTKHGTFGMDGHFTAVWSDSRLAYSPTTSYNPDGSVSNTGMCDHSISTNYHLTQDNPSDSKLMWIPDLYFLDEQKVEWRGSRSMTVFSNGTVEWTRSVSLTLHCDYRLDPFPFDVQTCSIKVGIYSQRLADVVIEWTDVRDPFYPYSWSTGGFSIALSEQAAYNMSFHATQSHSYISQDFIFTRNSVPVNKAYLTNCFVAVVFSYAGFFISAAAVPARVALGLLTAVFVITNKLGLAHTLPEVTYDIFLIDFLIHSFYFCAAAFIEFALVNYGTQCAAWLKANPPKTAGTAYTTKVRPSVMDDAGAPAPGAADDPPPAAPSPTMLAKLTRRWMTMCAALTNLDAICRVLFPLVYLSFTLYSFNGGLDAYLACARTSGEICS